LVFTYRGEAQGYGRHNRRGVHLSVSGSLRTCYSKKFSGTDVQAGGDVPPLQSQKSSKATCTTGNPL